MHRRIDRVVRTLLIVGLPLCVLACAAAQTADPAPAPQPVRMWHVGNSWSCPFPFDHVGLPRTFVLHTHGLGGTDEQAVTGGWIRQALDKDARGRKAFESGDFDVVYLGFVQLHEPVAGLDPIADLALARNPHCRIYLQQAWPWITKADVPHEEDDLDALEAGSNKGLKALEEKVDAINGRLGRRVLFINPVASAVMKLRRRVAAKEFPGITSQADVFNDTEGRRDDHAGTQIVVLAMYCAHAAIHRRSPVGLKITSPDGFWGHVQRADKGKIPVDDAQHAALQRIAWETVSTYPHAGVAPVPETPASPP